MFPTGLLRVYNIGMICLLTAGKIYYYTHT
jgi:hypothetical protein